jgi:hypothetical protein
MGVELFERPGESIVAELRALVSQAQAGDATVLPRIREILDGHPEIWEQVGNLSGLVEHSWTAVLAAGNPLSIESIQRTTAEMRAELAGEHPTCLERLLVDQVIACWMQLKYMETISADAPPGSLEQGKFRLKRLESAQNRYLNAIKTLTTVRALLPSGLAPAQSIKLHELKSKVG